MSAAPLRRPRTAPAVSPRPVADRRPHLRAVVAPEQARSLASLAWICVLIVLGALATVLLLNTQMAEGAYERRDLKIEIAGLHQERAALVSQLESNASPRNVAEAAAALGMEPHGTMGFLSIADGAVQEQGGR